MLKRLAFAFTLLAFRASGEESPKRPPNRAFSRCTPRRFAPVRPLGFDSRHFLTGARAVFNIPARRGDRR